MATTTAMTRRKPIDLGLRDRLGDLYAWHPGWPVEWSDQEQAEESQIYDEALREGVCRGCQKADGLEFAAYHRGREVRVLAVCLRCGESTDV